MGPACPPNPAAPNLARSTSSERIPGDAQGASENDPFGTPPPPRSKRMITVSIFQIKRLRLGAVKCLGRHGCQRLGGEEKGELLTGYRV